MRATSLLLPDDLQDDLRKAARREGTSVGEFIRRALRRALDDKRATPVRRRRQERDKLPHSIEEYLRSPVGSLGRPGARRRCPRSGRPIRGY